jgi:Ca-activated chloride channel family protein
MYNKYHYIRLYGRSGIIILVLMFYLTGISLAQADKKFIRHGNREYEKEKFSESEIFYRKAIDKNKESADALFNSGDALYKQKKYDDAGKQFAETNKMNEDKERKSTSLYNLGNSKLMANKLEESIEAYKNSLKLKPDNQEAKYNLAFAQDLLRKQQQQQNKDNQDQNNNQENKDRENKDQNKKQNDQEKQNNDKEQQQQQQQKQDQQSISKEDAERLLNAIANDEKNVQEKVKLAKAAKTKVKTLKNW